MRVRAEVVIRTGARPIDVRAALKVVDGKSEEELIENAVELIEAWSRWTPSPFQVWCKFLSMQKQIDALREQLELSQGRV